MNDAIYPVGKFQAPENYSHEDVQSWIKDIAELNENLEKVLSGLDENQLSKSYRKGGWNIAQIVNHLADSHINAYIRMKLAVEQNSPTINPYDENYWADLVDGKSFDLNPSIQLLNGLHQRWVQFLNSLSEEDLKRDYFHPEQGKKVSLAEALPSYAWHSRHHLGQIKNAIENPQ